MRAVLLLLSAVAIAFPSDLGSLYEASFLQREEARLHADLEKTIAQEITPFLTPSQTHAFSKLALATPVISEPDANPLDFYSAAPGQITVPLLTIAFVEDMSTAYSWLWANRFSSTTVDEYFGMLANHKPGDFPNGRYPAPLAALHIPADALDDPAVSEMALRVRATTLSYMLLHQFGHMSYRTAAEEATLKHHTEEREEILADAFALEVMKKNSETPAGLLMILHGMLYMPAAPAKLHPVSAQRLQSMADYLDVHVAEFVDGHRNPGVAGTAIHSLASHLRHSAGFLSNEESQRLWSEQGRQTTVASLAPRKPGAN